MVSFLPLTALCYWHYTHVTVFLSAVHSCMYMHVFAYICFLCVYVCFLLNAMCVSMALPGNYFRTSEKFFVKLHSRDGPDKWK